MDFQKNAFSILLKMQKKMFHRFAIGKGISCIKFLGIVQMMQKKRKEALNIAIFFFFWGGGGNTVFL